MNIRLYSSLTLSLMAFVIVLTMGCGSKRRAYDKELIAKTNQEFQNSPEFQYRIFQSETDSVSFYFRINSEKLLYARSEGGEMTAVVFIEINVLPSASDGPKIPSKIIKFVDRDDERIPKVLQAKTKMKIPAGYSYRIEFLLKDQQRQQTFPHGAILNREAKVDRAHFLAKVDSNNLVVFGDRIAPNVKYNVASLIANNGVNQILVDYYRRNFALPLPPFLLKEPPPFDYLPDSSFYLVANQQSEFSFTSATEGFYHFRPDSGIKEGFTLFVSGQEFPKVTTVKNMVEPLRYLLSNLEYKRIDNGMYNRTEFEKIWIDWAGTKEKAKTCIEAYYKRVEFCNSKFSSHVDGWKSDRGLIDQMDSDMPSLY